MTEIWVKVHSVIKSNSILHDDVMKWKHFPRYCPFVQGIHWSPVNSPHKGQWRGALMFSLIWAWMNDWVNNREAGDLRRHFAHYDDTLMVDIIINLAFTHCPCGAIWWQRFGSVLAQLMLCLIHKQYIPVQFKRDTSATKHWYYIAMYSHINSFKS